jgi:hypothetical protein
LIDGRRRGFQLEWRQSHKTGQQRIQVVLEFVLIFGINLNLDLKMKKQKQDNLNCEHCEQKSFGKLYLFVSRKHESVIGTHVDIQFNVASAWIVNDDSHVH